MIAGLDLMPEGMETGVFLFLVATSFAGSFITVAFGIGGGGLLLAVMATLVPVSALIPVHGMIQTGSNAGRFFMLIRQVFWQALPWFTLGTLVGCAVGGLIVVELPASTVQIGVGAFVIYTVFARSPEWLKNFPFLTGLISSFLTMFFGATGLFVASFTKSHRLPRHEHVATHAALMTVQHLLKVVVFGFLGFSFGVWGGFVVVMILAGLLGTLIGRLFLDRFNDVWFRRALDTILVLISARLILAGLGLI